MLFLVHNLVFSKLDIEIAYFYPAGKKTNLTILSQNDIH